MPTDQPSNRYDVLRYSSGEVPPIRAVVAGRGEQIVSAHEQEAQRLARRWWLLVGLVGVTPPVYTSVVGSSLLLGLGVAVVGLAVAWRVRTPPEQHVPLLVAEGVSLDRAREEYDAAVHDDRPIIESQTKPKLRPIDR